MSVYLCFAWVYWLLCQLCLRVPSRRKKFAYFKWKDGAIRGSLICLGCVLFVACGTHPPSTYVPSDPVYNNEFRQTGMMPVLVFPDDPIKAIYDDSQFLPNTPYTGGGLADVIAHGIVNLAVKQINSSVADKRKKEAYQTAQPVIEQLSSYDLKSDVAYSLVSEMKDVQGLKLTTPVRSTNTQT